MSAEWARKIITGETPSPRRAELDARVMFTNCSGISEELRFPQGEEKS